MRLGVISLVTLAIFSLCCASPEDTASLVAALQNEAQPELERPDPYRDAQGVAIDSARIEATEDELAEVRHGDLAGKAVAERPSDPRYPGICARTAPHASVWGDSDGISFSYRSSRRVAAELYFDDAAFWEDRAAPVAAQTFDSGLHTQHLAAPSGATFILVLRAGCGERLYRVATPAPSWRDPSVCPDGVVIADPGNIQNYSFTSDVQNVIDASATIAPDSLEIDYTFNGAEVVHFRGSDFAEQDLSQFTHFCIPYRGLANGPDVAIGLILRGADVDPAFGEALAWVRVEEVTDLPVTRAWTVDASEFVSLSGNLDIHRVRGFDISISCRTNGSWSVCPASGVSGNVRFGSLRGLELDPAPRAPERVAHRPHHMASIADQLASSGSSCTGLVSGGSIQGSLRYLYPNGLRLSVLSRAGRAEALQLAQTLTQIQQSDGSFCAEYYESQCWVSPANQCRKIPGAMAYAGLGLLEAEASHPGNGFREAAEDLVAYLEGLLVNGGSLENSTEGNISAYLFLSAASSLGILVQEATLQSLRTLIESRYVNGRLMTSATGNTLALDVTAGLAAAYWMERHDPTRLERSLGLARELFATRSFDGSLEGFGDVTGPWTVNAEWGVGMYATYGGVDGEFVMRRYLETHVSGGNVMGSPDDFAADFISVNHRLPSVAAAAWVYFALEGQRYPLDRID